MNVLDGIRVIDLSNAYSAPIATLQLADFGADVIKIENTGTGDSSRTWNPFIGGESMHYMYMNRNKRSVSLNLKSEAGKQALSRLAETADIVVENFRPGVAKKLGVNHTIARIRTDYVHEQQARYRTAIADLEQRINGASTSERVKLNKRLAALQAQAEEIRVYEEKIHHLADQMIKIDLDDGVKKNYAIFQDVLAKIK